MLAAEADARWEAKGSLLAYPEGVQGRRMLSEGRLGRGMERVSSGHESIAGKEDATETPKQAEEEKEQPLSKPDPWKQTRGGPSEQWQPTTWDGSGGAAAPRR